MKKEVTLMPKNKSPLEFLLEKEREIGNAWVFIHSSVYEKLSESCDKFTVAPDDTIACMKWYSAGTRPKIVLQCYVSQGDWEKVLSIRVKDVSDYFVPADPDDVYFFKMEE